MAGVVAGEPLREAVDAIVVLEGEGAQGKRI